MSEVRQRATSLIIDEINQEAGGWSIIVWIGIKRKSKWQEHISTTYEGCNLPAQYVFIAVRVGGRSSS